MNQIKDDFEFKFYEIERENGKEKKLNALFPAFYSVDFVKNNKKMLEEIFNYTIYYFYIRQLTCGNEMKKAIKEMKYPFDDLSLFNVNYRDGDLERSAIINPMIYRHRKQDLQISPCMIVSGDLNGFTVSPGPFSDFHINESLQYKNRLFGSTRDFIPYEISLTVLFLEDFMKNVNRIAIKNDIPSDFAEKSNSRSVYVLDEEYRRLVRSIQYAIWKKTSANKSKRIDILSVNGKTIYDWMKELDINYVISFNSQEQLKIAMELGKSPKQVFQFVEKTLKKLREE